MKHIPNYHKRLLIKKLFSDSDLLPRILFLGVHGSSLFESIDMRTESDIDIEIIIDHYQENDYQVILSIIKSFPFKTECQLRYKNEIIPPNLISTSFYKIFMYFHYANAITLIGENIYKKLIKTIENKLVKKSILISAQIAFKDVRKSYFSSKSAYEINKQIGRFLLLLSLYYGYIDYKKLGTKEAFLLVERGSIAVRCAKFFTKYLDLEEKKVLLNFKRYVAMKKIDLMIFAVINKLNERIFKLKLNQDAPFRPIHPRTLRPGKRYIARSREGILEFKPRKGSILQTPSGVIPQKTN